MFRRLLLAALVAVLLLAVASAAAEDNKKRSLTSVSGDVDTPDGASGRALLDKHHKSKHEEPKHKKGFFGRMALSVGLAGGAGQDADGAGQPGPAGRSLLGGGYGRGYGGYYGRGYYRPYYGYGRGYGYYGRR